MAKDTLTPRQKRFIQEYLKDLNATQAAIRAGYGAKGAHVAGSRLLKDRKVRAAVDAAQQHRSERAQISADMVLEGLARIAFVDVSKAYAADGVMLQPEKMPEGVRGALQGITIAKTGERVPVFADRRGALVDLGKHLGLFRDKVEVSGEEGGPVVVEVRTYKGGGSA